MCHRLWSGTDASYVDGNRNEYSTEELQPCPNCVSTLADKAKTTYTYTYTFCSQSSHYFISQQKE